MEDRKITQEWMFEALNRYGISRAEAEVYVFLAFEGPKKTKDIAKVTKIQRRKIYRILSKLGEKKFINSTSIAPFKFSAVSFDQVLNLLINNNIADAKWLEEKKIEIHALREHALKEQQAADSKQEDHLK